MSWRARIAKLTLRVPEAFGARLRTASAKGAANLAEDVRVFREGRIVNILGNPDHITVGPHTRIRSELMTFAHAGRIVIGSWFYLGPGSMIWSSDETGIVIGDRVLVSANVMIHDTNSHPLDHRARLEQTKAIFGNGHPKSITGIRSAPVTIIDNLWASMLLPARTIIQKRRGIGQ